MRLYPHLRYDNGVACVRGVILQDNVLYAQGGAADAAVGGRRVGERHWDRQVRTDRRSGAIDATRPQHATTRAGEGVLNATGCIVGHRVDDSLAGEIDGPGVAKPA